MKKLLVEALLALRKGLKKAGSFVLNIGRKVMSPIDKGLCKLEEFSPFFFGQIRLALVMVGIMLFALIPIAIMATAMTGQISIVTAVVFIIVSVPVVLLHMLIDPSILLSVVVCTMMLSVFFSIIDILSKWAVNTGFEYRKQAAIDAAKACNPNQI